MTEIKAGDKVTLRDNYSGGTVWNVVAVDNGAAWLRRSTGLYGAIEPLGNLEKIEPFYEVGKVYADKNYFFAVKAIWSEGDKKLASGWEWHREDDRASGWGFTASTMNPNFSTYKLHGDDKD